MHVDTALACAVVGAVSSWFVPWLVARLPEPAAAPEDETGDTDPLAPDEEKPPYVDLAATPGLAWKSALAGAVCAGLIGLEIGWAWPLTFLLYLVPVGVALAFVDFRTRLLPTRLVAPSYLVVGVLVLLSGVVTGDGAALVRALLGWLLAGLLFWLLWRFTPGMGYGDVRLSGVLGMALGYLGWGELLTGIYAGFLVGVVGWVPLRLLRITRDRKLPFGPFMLAGAVVGILWGADVAGHLVDRQA
jgi:leader peptidase (prepilin peptidase)/N-methyltransferase